MTEHGLTLHDWRLEIDREDIAWLVFDRAGEQVNSLGRRPLEELAEIVAWAEKAARDKTIRGIAVLSGKPNSFIVGADIREFDALDTEAKVIEAITPVNQMLDRIEALPVPVVCGIHGHCLGGGLELALACDYRIGTRDDATRVGFPEVKLGLFPGFNGTARSIRQVGALAAMQNMLTGAMLRANVARRLGYIDALVPGPLELRWAVRRAILRNRKSKPAGATRRLLSQWPARGLIAAKMRKETAKKVRETHYPAPFRLINLFEHYGGSLATLKREETKAFAPLMVGETSRNLRRVFELSEMLKAQAPKGSNFKVRHVHVIGAGVMGADIAGWCVASGMQASLQDLSTEQIEKGIAAQDKVLKRRFRTRAQRDAAKARLIADPDGSYLPRADLVIEAIVEKLDVKQKLFRDIEGRLKPGAVLATNTSSLMIEHIAEGLSDPARLIGIHFFNPVAQMPLVEVIHGAHSRADEIEKGCVFVTALGKFPLIAKSLPGFLVNRVLAPYMFEAFERVEKGEAKEKIDEAAKAFGMPMGPIELADTVGLDVCLHVGEILAKESADKDRLAQSRLARLVASKRLGKKSGEGFYVWKDGKPQQQDLPSEAGSLEQLGKELLTPLIDECERCLADGVVANADLIDAGVIFGTGFAPFRGGPLHYRRTHTAAVTETPRAAAE
jgi:3-hydroxyacyl-CoA dehydrogenase / enoyl-CoA hydratase / 3-hydroxybutyryl-CoA epimerase